MTIQPSSDLVLDVSRAADPLEYRASVEKLRNAQSATRLANQPNGETAFSEIANLVNNARGSTRLESNNSQLQVNDNVQNSKRAEAYKKFEAFMLQSFIQNMFTTDTPSVFGKGQAGEYWKSMMAEAIAGEVADHGGIGVAKMLERSEQIKERSLVDNGNEDLQTIFGQFVSANKNPQATADNIVHNNDLDFIRKQMSKNT